MPCNNHKCVWLPLWRGWPWSCALLKHVTCEFVARFWYMCLLTRNCSTPPPPPPFIIIVIIIIIITIIIIIITLLSHTSSYWQHTLSHTIHTRVSPSILPSRITSRPLLNFHIIFDTWGIWVIFWYPHPFDLSDQDTLEFEVSSGFKTKRIQDPRTSRFHKETHNRGQELLHTKILAWKKKSAERNAAFAKTCFIWKTLEVIVTENIDQRGSGTPRQPSQALLKMIRTRPNFFVILLQQVFLSKFRFNVCKYFFRKGPIGILLIRWKILHLRYDIFSPNESNGITGEAAQVLLQVSHRMALCSRCQLAGIDGAAGGMPPMRFRWARERHGVPKYWTPQVDPTLSII